MVHTLRLYRQLVLLSKLSILLICLSSFVTAHEMTPAYPELKPSHVKGVVKAQMSLFNQREDVKYYMIEVFDKNFISMPFSSPYRIMKLEYKERKNFVVYLRKSDLRRAVYICTTSKVIKQRSSTPLISSRICSRIDGGTA